MDFSGPGSPVSSPPAAAPTGQTGGGDQDAVAQSEAASASNSHLTVDQDHNDDNDSAYGEDDSNSQTTSVMSSIYRGMIENGRKYQTIREGKYWGPSDDAQFDTFEAGHLLMLIMDSAEENQLFRSPIKENAQHIIDLGTGVGSWPIEVADRYPHVTVRGVDLYPPPASWVPPNCILEVDDISRDWTWRKKFDLIHMRLLLGAFTPEEWDALYARCYENLLPGGWIEQVELDVRVLSDDSSLSPTSLLAGWGPNFLGCGVRAGRPLDTQLTMKSCIERAGFINVQEKLYKMPIGAWPKHPVYKDAGRVNREHWKSGLEGWAMYLLTKFGEPVPWSAEEVRVYVASVRAELAKGGVHIYHFTRRVWAQKPE